MLDVLERGVEAGSSTLQDQEERDSANRQARCNLGKSWMERKLVELRFCVIGESYSIEFWLCVCSRRPQEGPAELSWHRSQVMQRYLGLAPQLTEDEVE